jgi:hypothetical protein
MNMTHAAKKWRGLEGAVGVGCSLLFRETKKVFSTHPQSLCQDVVHARIPSQKSNIFPWSLLITKDSIHSTRILPTLVAHETLL